MLGLAAGLPGSSPGLFGQQYGGGNYQQQQHMLMNLNQSYQQLLYHQQDSTTRLCRLEQLLAHSRDTADSPVDRPSRDRLERANSFPTSPAGEYQAPTVQIPASAHTLPSNRMLNQTFTLQPRLVPFESDGLAFLNNPGAYAASNGYSGASSESKLDVAGFVRNKDALSQKVAAAERSIAAKEKAIKEQEQLIKVRRQNWQRQQAAAGDVDAVPIQTIHASDQVPRLNLEDILKAKPKSRSKHVGGMTSKKDGELNTHTIYS